MPADTVEALSQHIHTLSTNHTNTSARIEHTLASRSQEAGSLIDAIRDTRSEFSILREELDRKSKENAALQLGQEYRLRRPALKAVAHALQIIIEDERATRDPTQTIQGVKAELQECLEDNQVTLISFPPGTPLATTKEISYSESTPVPTADGQDRGTVESTLRPAFVFTAPNGTQDILIPSRVTYYS